MTDGSDSVRFSASDRVLLTRMPDGTGLLLHLDTKFYFALNGTGTFVWERLSSGPQQLSEIVTALCQHYEVNCETAEGDTLRLLDVLERERAVLRH